MGKKGTTQKFLFLDNSNLELGTGWSFSDDAEIKRSPSVDGNGMIYPGVYGPCARIRRVMHKPQRYPKFPLIESEHPWEGNICYFGGRYLDHDPETGQESKSQRGNYK